MKLCPTCQQCYEDTYAFCTSDQTALIQSRSGTRLIAQKYRLDRLLNSGGMNAVYAGTQIETSQPVAVKLLLPNSFSNPETLKRFRQEVLAVAHLNTRVTHQHVVKTYAYGVLSDGSAYVVMELVTGQTLREYLNSAGPLPVAEAVKIVRQVADGLEAAHRCGVVHGDLNPSSIILAHDYHDNLEVKVVGFGFAKLREQKMKGNGRDTSSGESPHDAAAYMSPEGWAGEDLDVRSDIYSLGVILYEMLAGRLPFQSPSVITAHPQHTGEPSPLEDLRADVPEQLSQLVMQALQKKSAARPHTVAEFARQLSMAGHFKTDDAPISAEVDEAAPEQSLSSATVSTIPSDNGSSFERGVVAADLREQEYQLQARGVGALPFDDSHLDREERSSHANEVTSTALADAYDAFIEKATPRRHSSDLITSPPVPETSVREPAHFDIASTPPARRRPLFLYASLTVIVLAVGIAATFWFTRRTTAPTRPLVQQTAMTPLPPPPARPLEQTNPEPPNKGPDSRDVAGNLPPANPVESPSNEIEKSQLTKEERAALHTARDKKSVTQATDEQAANPNGFGMDATSSSINKTASHSTPTPSSVEAKIAPERQPGSNGGDMMSVNESSLSIRNGGSGTVTVNVNGRCSPADVSASTPDWSNIVVISQPPGGKGSDSVRYSIVSVSRNTGTYAINFKSPCGTKRVMVTVK